MGLITNPTHLTLNSRPWQTLEKFQQARKLFDEWRTKRQGTLKTLEDWKRWNSFRRQRELRREGKFTGTGEVVGQAKRMFLKAYANKLWGLPGGNYREVSDWLTNNGYPTSEGDIKNAKRSSIDPENLWVVGVEEIIEFQQLVVSAYPMCQAKLM